MNHIFKRVLIIVLAIFLTGQPLLFASVLYTDKEALEILLPEAEDIKEEIKTLTPQQRDAIAQEADIKFNEEYDKEFHFYIGKSKGNIIGYVVKDKVKGKWGPIEYMAAISPEGRIINVVVLSLSEKRGRPVAKQRFLKQYIGKTKEDRIKLRKDIKGISGATISSRGMTGGIRKVIHIFNEFYGEK